MWSSPSAQASTSHLFLRAYATPAEPSRDRPEVDGKDNSEVPVNHQAQDDPSAAPKTPRLTSAFDINSSASDLVTLREGKQTTGARKRGASQEMKEQRRRRWLISAIGTFGIVGTGYTIQQLGREWETPEELEKYAPNPSQDAFLTRARLRLKSMYTSFQAPVWEKLLPDPLPFPYNRPFTLVVDLDDLLIHSEWTRETAWKTAKRPGLDYFLGYLGQFYEIVLFTKQPFYVVSGIIEKLDPDRRLFSYHLFRESCRTLSNGQVVKDLSALNRDLSKVIILDTDPEAVQLQPENAILVKKWDGKADDRELIGMLDFLEAVGIYDIADVRQTIKGYEGTHIPTEHAKRQAALKAKFEEDWKLKHQSKNSWIGGFRSATNRSDVPQTFYDLEKERFQKAYVEEQKYWKENGPMLRKQAEEEHLKQMQSNPWNFFSRQVPPSPEQQQQEQQK